MGKNNSAKTRKNKLGHIRNLIEDKKYKRALYEIVNYVNTYPQDSLGHYLYGKLLLRKNELQEAKRQFLIVAEQQDEHEVKSLMNLATIARIEGDPEEAIKYYKRVIEDSEYTDTYAINVLAHLYRYEKRHKEAIELISKSSLEPELIKELAKNLSILGKTNEALIILEKYIPYTKREERELALNKGRIAKAKDDYDQAYFYYEEAKDTDEKDSIYYKAVYEEIKLAIAYDKYEEAIVLCKELLEINNHFNGEIYLLFGLANQGIKEYNEAYKSYIKATQHAIDRDVKAEAYYNLGSLEFAKNALSPAEKAFKISVANAREISPQTYTKLIAVLFRQEKYEEVLKYLQKLKKANPRLYNDTPLEHVKLLVDKRQHKKLPQRDTCPYSEKQIIKYREKDAIEHIKNHHQTNTKTRGNFAPHIDIECLYYDVRSSLSPNNIINEDVMDIYEIDYRNVGYDLEDNLVHKIRVVVLPSTKNILTMYPGCRATVPNKSELTPKTQKQKIKTITEN